MSTRSKIEFKDEKLQDISLLYLDRLTEILSDDDIWINLAKQMGFRANDIENFQKIARDRRESPVKEVILKWSDYGHTITELFVVLSRIGATRAMEAIKPLVDKKFHRLILPDPVRAEEPSKSNFQQTRREHKHQNTQVFSNDNNESVATGPRSDQKEAKPADVNSITHQLQNLGTYTSSIPEIDFRELQDATNNWSTENILGKGGFGTVFKGIWKYTAVAIKKVENRAGESLEMTKIQLQQSLNELMFLNSFRHDNILPLYGFSMNGREPCLVYQLMTEGSLENRLNPSRKDQLLDWNQRLKILRGSAR
jgi:interleukin-1 receptor-associated kinase 1